jgi:hypothetical protein
VEPPITISEAAQCILNASLLLGKLEDEERLPSVPLRRGFVTCGEMEELLVLVMALAHCVYPELSDEDSLDVALRESGVSRLIS